jgi:hypothetical protein
LACSLLEYFGFGGLGLAGLFSFSADTDDGHIIADVLVSSFSGVISSSLNKGEWKSICPGESKL